MRYTEVPLSYEGLGEENIVEFVLFLTLICSKKIEVN
jgi:hypothetical protein